MPSHAVVRLTEHLAVRVDEALAGAYDQDLTVFLFLETTVLFLAYQGTSSVLATRHWGDTGARADEYVER